MKTLLIAITFAMMPLFATGQHITGQNFIETSGADIGVSGKYQIIITDSSFAFDFSRPMQAVQVTNNLQQRFKFQKQIFELKIKNRRRTKTGYKVVFTNGSRAIIKLDANKKLTSIRYYEGKRESGAMFYFYNFTNID